MDAFIFDDKDAGGFLPVAEVDALAPEVARIAGELTRREGPGAAFLGWLDPEAACPPNEHAALRDAAREARGDCDAYVVIGIGGSSLGARAVLEALRDHASGPEIIFAGTGLDAADTGRLLRRLRDREPRLCVISKSGTTLEPALAFRFLRAQLVERYGRRGAARRITVVTDASRGLLRAMARAEGYRALTVPDDIGGRFSVLTAVGLLPLAVAGIDTEALVAGAAAMRDRCHEPRLRANPAHLYAATRRALDARGFRTEILSAFHSDLRGVQEWWKQLFGESEGKQGGGVFPAAAAMTSDLHSLGQYIQDGRRDLFETFLCVDRTDPALVVPPTRADEPDDGLADLAGRPLDEINARAWEGVRQAHVAGGVPCLSVTLAALTPRSVGGLLYFFQKAVAVSGRLQGVNPFDQPGVEAYKREMHRLLGRS